jgi:hypothetical protein
MNYAARAVLVRCAALALALTVLPSAALAGAEETFHKRVLDLGPATDVGAPAAAQLFREALMAPPGEVDPGARAFCGRYLPVIRRTLDAKPELSCVGKLDVLQATALCRWFSGADEEAGALARELARSRCVDPDVDGLDRAIGLAERWLWTEPVRALVQAQAEGDAALANRTRLETVDNRRRMAIAAFGGNGWGRGLLVVARSAMGPAGRAGMDVGDVVLNVNAQPVWSDAAMRTLVGDGTRRHAVTTTRDGRRVEVSWLGSLDGVTLLPLPERTAGR